MDNATNPAQVKFYRFLPVFDVNIHENLCSMCPVERPVKNGFAASQNLSFAAREPFFICYAKLSWIES
jgi:hypothetical protein